MATLSEKEKDVIIQALQFYLQQASAQLPPAHLQPLVKLVQGIAAKIDTLDAAGGAPGAPGAKGPIPPGITEEWFEECCTSCPNLVATGCADKVTAKFPGKCDPILRYERRKAGLV